MTNLKKVLGAVLTSVTGFLTITSLVSCSGKKSDAKELYATYGRPGSVYYAGAFPSVDSPDFVHDNTQYSFDGLLSNKESHNLKIINAQYWIETFKEAGLIEGYENVDPGDIEEVATTRLNELFVSQVRSWSYKLDTVEFLTKYYAMTGAHSIKYGFYRKSDFEYILGLISGDITTTNEIDVENATDYLEEFFSAAQNAFWYIQKKYGIKDGRSTVSSIDYYYDLTEAFLKSDKEYPLYDVVNALDKEHKKIMEEKDVEVLSNSLVNIYSTLATLAFGEGFLVGDTYYTIDDFKGAENLEVASIVRMCVANVAPLVEMSDVDYVQFKEKDGSIGVMKVEAINDFYYETFAEIWRQNLAGSMMSPVAPDIATKTNEGSTLIWKIRNNSSHY